MSNRDYHPGENGASFVGYISDDRCTLDLSLRRDDD